MSTLTDIQKRIKELIAELVIFKKVEAHLDETDAQLESLYEELKTKSKQLDKELKDIESLEGLGLKTLLHNVLGNKEEQLEKERQEYLALSLEYNECKKEVELLEYERKLLAKKVKNLPQIEAALAQQKDLRRMEIEAMPHSEIGQRYLELAHDLDIQEALCKETDEAVKSGAEARELLRSIVDNLRAAQRTREWSGQSRRSMTNRQMRIRYVNAAVMHVAGCQQRLDLFVKELSDLGGRNAHLTLRNVAFPRLRNHFFGNLISDWVINQEINKALSQIVSIYNEVEELVRTLRLEYDAVMKNKQTLRSQIDTLLTQ